MARSTSNVSESEREQRRARSGTAQAGRRAAFDLGGVGAAGSVRSRNGLARYSVNSQLLIALARPDATFVAGFRAWLELGCQVGKGEKAIWILAPLTIKERDRVSGEETGETRALFRAVSLFDRAQVTAGEHATPLDPPVEPLSGDSHQHLLEQLADRIAISSSSATDPFKPSTPPTVNAVKAGQARLHPAGGLRSNDAGVEWRHRRGNTRSATTIASPTCASTHGATRVWPPVGGTEAVGAGRIRPPARRSSGGCRARFTARTRC